MDCAAKFERAVSRLPGVAGANLNTITGKLIVKGTADLESIRKLGKEENYTVNRVQTQASIEAPTQQIDWELRRAIISGIALTIAFIIEKLGVPAFVFIPLYVVTMVTT